MSLTKSGPLKSLVATVLCAALLPAAVAPASAGPKVSTKEHPYLLFTMEELRELRAEAQKIVPRAVHASLRRKIRRARSDPGFLAFGGLWTDDPKALDKARAALLKQAGGRTAQRYTVHTGSAMRSFAYGYDWLYAGLSEEQRKTARDYIVRQVRRGLSQWRDRTDRRGGNWEASIYGSFVACGLAVINEVPEAKDWVAVGIRGITRGYLTMTMDPEGAAYEPFVRYHLNVSFYSILPALEAYRRVTGENRFGANDEILRKHAAFYAYMLYPNRKGVCNFGDTRAHLYPVYPYLVKAAAEYKDGLAAWYLKTHMADGLGLNNWGTVCYLLWAGEAAKAEPVDPDTSPRLPLGKAYVKDPRARNRLPSMGHVFMRTGFTRTDDIQFAMGGNLASQHGHGDKGGYILNAFGETFLQDPFLHEGSYRSPSATFYRSDESHNVVAIGEGGQTYIRGGGLWDRHFGSHLATVERFHHCKRCDYARVDLRRAYRMHPKNSRSVKRAVRHVVFLRGERPKGAFVVIDDFRKDDRAHVYSHNFHPGPDVEVASADGGRIVLKGKRASCLVALVHPEGVRLERKEQFKSKYLKAICGKSRVRLNLVTVLYPTTGDPAEAPVSRTVDGKVITVRVGGRTIAFDAAKGLVRVDGVTTRELIRKAGGGKRNY
ncbi:MAG: heparinase II/III domain-containing protein [Planctomycetota bacterium]|jgi:hypothetical protein